MIILLKWAALLVTALLVAGLALYLGTRGEYPVPKLVTEDPSLPSETVSGIRLHMRVVEGPEDAPVIVVLHGGPGGDFRSLQALAQLSDQFTLVFYDQRGAGLSERVPAESLTLEGHLEELAAVIDLVSPDRAPILIGHSWGAMLAAAYLGKSPEAIRAAILIEPGYLDAQGHAAWRAQSQRYLSGAAYWRKALLTGFRAQHVSGPDPSAAEDYLIGHMVGVFTNHPDNPYHCGTGYSAPSWRFGALSSQTWEATSKAPLEQLTAEAKRFGGPVMIMAGACNSWIGAPLQEKHLSAFKSGELTVIPEAGHDVIWDNPAATLDAIKEFLSRDPVD